LTGEFSSPDKHTWRERLRSVAAGVPSLHPPKATIGLPMASVWRVDDREIVGYANVLKATMLPSVVPRIPLEG
jgi:hypothetical protein